MLQKEFSLLFLEIVHSNNFFQNEWIRMLL